MSFPTRLRFAVCAALVLALAGCGGGMGGLFGGAAQPASPERQAMLENLNEPMSREERADRARGFTPLTERRSVLGDLFRARRESDVGTNVNRYLWNASLDALSFLPVETVDPFTGVIATGYGTPPGGGRAYRATIYISDPALDARSLKVAIQTRGGGPVSAQTVRAVEDAILTRARELRVRDSRL
ncbi:MAG: DUF3576 domain-containing protein [Gemmobacter sp.]|jgi:hypothetical protein|nr:DUF3576 domain-containing protein [Gemmobacter sp.]